jgi:CubicO group peptidase (beta-lactamase class C family)
LISNLPETLLRTQDLRQFPAYSSVIERTRGYVRVSAGTITRTALHRDGLGCTLIDPATPETATAQLASPKSYPQIPEDSPDHPAVLPVALSSAVEPIIENAFLEKEPGRLKFTRAMVVLKNGKIVGEHYAPGISADTPLPGYSMTKGIASLWAGVLVGRGWLKLSDQALMPGWQQHSDRRREISVDHLLRMTSGLSWTESYDGSSSDLMRMLTSAASAAMFAADKPLSLATEVGSSSQPGPMSTLKADLSVEPGQYWRYSGGSYEILSAVLRASIERNGADYHRFPYDELFRKIGMTSATLEAGPDGNYLLSAFSVATARDWARLGNFLLNEYQGRNSHLLAADWIRRSTMPTVDRDGTKIRDYGAAFWLGSLGKNAPSDAFFLAGLQGQYAVVVPSCGLVVVRLGATAAEGTWVIQPTIDELAASLCRR